MSAIPHIYHNIRPQDFSITPFQVYKRYIVAYNEWEASGYTNHEGLFSSLKTPISSSKAINDPRNSDGTYKHIIWQAINHRYYKYPYDPIYGGEHSNRRYVYKNLFLTASILSIPYMDSGEGLKPNSIQITSSGYYLKDDGYGNLYDTSFITSSFTKRNNLVAYWGFNDLYKSTRYGFGYKKRVYINYLSHTHEPDTKSVGSNLYIQPGISVHTPKSSSGVSVGFRGETTIATHHRQDFNFPANKNFTLSFFIKFPVSQSITTYIANTVISKKGTIRKQVYGNLPHTNAGGSIIPTQFVSSSIINQKTGIYPFDFEILNQTSGISNSGKLRFKRSDGTFLRILTTTGSIANNQWQHITVTKTNKLLSLYVNGLLHQTGSDVVDHPNNDHMLIFGANNIDYENAFSGSLDEIRFYNYAASQTEIQTLCERERGYLYQTSAVGNVFYKNSTVVISSLLPKYNKVFNNTNWNIKFRNTLTIYQMDVWCRIKKGSGNLTMNPTARQDPDSDLFINDFTGSLLTPYITTIGMYNQKGDLLMIGKLGQPVKMREDVDITFRCSIDL